MGYAWDITITAGKTKTAPSQQTLQLHPGIITRIGVRFPRGCHGLVYVRLTRGGVFQIYPLSAGQWIAGDDEEVAFNYHFDLSDRPRELMFEGASPTCTYDHTVTVRVTVLPKWAASMLPVVELLTKVLQRLGVV